MINSSEEHKHSLAFELQNSRVFGQHIKRQLIFLVILISFSASGIASLTGSETPVTAGIMDIGAATAGLYSVPIFNVPPSAGMQAAAQLSAPNPNATSPRPSILRKRTSEGYVGIFSYNSLYFLVSCCHTPVSWENNHLKETQLQTGIFLFVWEVMSNWVLRFILQNGNNKCQALLPLHLIHDSWVCNEVAIIIIISLFNCSTQI